MELLSHLHFEGAAVLSRLSIIILLLLIPVAIALLSQQITRTVPPPKLSGGIIEVPLHDTDDMSGHGADAATEIGLPDSYIPRTIKHKYNMGPGDEARRVDGVRGKGADGSHRDGIRDERQNGGLERGMEPETEAGEPHSHQKRGTP